MDIHVQLTLLDFGRFGRNNGYGWVWLARRDYLLLRLHEMLWFQGWDLLFCWCRALEILWLDSTAVGR
jgi:hypothetical protein